MKIGKRLSSDAKTAVWIIAWFFGFLLGFYHGWGLREAAVLPESRATEKYYEARCKQAITKAFGSEVK